jgi:hypothetical protein
MDTPPYFEISGEGLGRCGQVACPRQAVATRTADTRQREFAHRTKSTRLVRVVVCDRQAVCENLRCATLRGADLSDATPGNFGLQ